VVSERRDGRVYYRFLDTFKAGDAPFTPDEILALAFGEDLLRTLEGTVFHDSIRSALGKIRAGLSPELLEYLSRLAESFRVGPGPHKRYARFRDTIRVLNDAVLARRTVRMRYHTGRTGTVATRSLDPYRVWYRNGALYVIGHDHRSGEIRTFAVDRIRSLDATARGFSVPAGFDFDAYVASSFGVIAEPATRVRLRFARRWATEVLERTWHPSQQVRELPGGGVLLELEVGSTPELVSWVLSFGSGAEVLEPEQLRDAIRRQLEATLEVYARKPEPVTRRGSASSPRAAARGSRTASRPASTRPGSAP
jgi:predicted DNA-binding transcriptional regulator YafY